ncbi:hypothetical protein [Neopusillimonas aromaticivorans]|uniref:hypothetical protein n=1 Tax=Neopusillimonas aromaticivorans TaxID=2979868 RepID=UPI002597A162|nr:hypothetical protein [Neopusillimonas aromaticivorans]WJJ93540.1 hypothetical protein N7E01_16780 [Neopusillimonas aromaticivorans]
MEDGSGTDDTDPDENDEDASGDAASGGLDADEDAGLDRPLPGVDAGRVAAAEGNDAPGKAVPVSADEATEPAAGEEAAVVAVEASLMKPQSCLKRQRQLPCPTRFQRLQRRHRQPCRQHLRGPQCPPRRLQKQQCLAVATLH